MLTTKEKAPEEVPSEEEWEAMAAVPMQSVADVENAKEADELKESAEKETGVVRCVVAEEEKPQEITELEAITKEGNDNEMTQRSIVVMVKTTEHESMLGHAACQVDHREKIIRRLVLRPREKQISESSLLKNILEERPQISEQLQAQKIKRNKKHDKPDKREVLMIKTTSNWC